MFVKQQFIKRVVLTSSIVAVLAGLGGVFLFFQIAARVTLAPLVLLTVLTELVFPLVTAPMGALIAARRAQYAVGGVLVGLALAHAIPSLAQNYVILNYLAGTTPGSVPLLALTQVFVVPMLIVLLLLLFPTGQFLSPRWGWVGMAAVAYNLLALGATLLETRWAISAARLTLIVTNPFGLWLVTTPVLVILPMFGLMAISVAGTLIRYRRARFEERQQLKWFAYFAGLLILALALYTLRPDLVILVNLVALGLPVAIALAILKYRLYDIDLIIRRTVTYALLTALLLGVFAVSVIVLQQVLASLTGTRQNELVTVLSTLAIAALFVPLRNRIQTIIDKRFNRRKYDMQQVLADFAATVRDETDLENLTARLMQVVDETMQPQSVSVWLRKDKGA